MAETPKTPEKDNPELPINPNAANASADGKSTTDSIKNDLDELISTSVNSGTNTPDAKIDFTATPDAAAKAQEAKKKALKRSRKIPTYIITFSVLIVVMLGIGSLAFLFNQYISYQKTGVVSSNWAEYMPWVEQKYEYVLRTFGLEQIDKYTPQQVVTTNTSKKNIIANIVEDTDVGFLTKKKVLQQGVKLLYSDVANRYDNYENLKTTIGQQGFFPKGVQILSQNLNFDGSLQKAIVSVESVRFVVALKYFSLLDSFTTQLSSYASMSKEVVAEKLQMFVSRGEKDINNYITSCYLNGYETSMSCSSIGDFDNYYNYIDSSFTKEDRRLFLITMDAIEAKLENTDFPSLDISVNNIDTLNHTISLKIEVNTLREDEAKLTLENNIANPHIYLITNVINYLRESRYVITEDVKLNTLSIDKKKVKVGGQTITVHSSSFSFELPLQNEVMREIYDFTDNSSLIE